MVGTVVESLGSMMGNGRMKTYPFHPQSSWTIERWNRTLTRELASFVATGDED